MPFERAIGRMIVSKLVKTDLSQGGIMRAVRRLGAGYRTELMIADIKLFSGRFSNEFFVRKLGYNEVVPRYLMNETVLGTPRKYRVFGKSTYWDSSNDTYITKTESFYWDDLSKKGEWEDMYGAGGYERYDEQDLEFTNFNVTAVDHNAGWNY